MLPSVTSFSWSHWGFRVAQSLLVLSIFAGCTSAATTQRIKSLEDQVLVLHNRADRMEERVSGIEWAARRPEKPKDAASEEERPNLPVFRLSPGSSLAPEPQPAGEESESEPRPGGQPQEESAPRSTSPSGASETGGVTGTKGKPAANDADAPHTRIEPHRPSSELWMPRGSIHGVGGGRLGRVGPAAMMVWSEEEARCDAV